MPGGEDLLVDPDLHGRVDVAHDEHAARLAHDLAGRAGVQELADDGRGASLISVTLAKVGPDVGDPPGERAALDDDDVAQLDPVVGALVEGDHPPRLEQLAPDDARPRRSRGRSRSGAGAAP